MIELDLENTTIKLIFTNGHIQTITRRYGRKPGKEITLEEFHSGVICKRRVIWYVFGLNQLAFIFLTFCISDGRSWSAATKGGWSYQWEFDGLRQRGRPTSRIKATTLVVLFLIFVNFVGLNVSGNLYFYPFSWRYNRV